MTTHPSAPTSRLAQSIQLLASLLKLLLWPVRHVATLLFPASDLDGLAPAVTAKAAAQMVSYLQSQSSSPLWATSAWTRTSGGFAAVQHDALATQSLIFLYLHAPLHGQTRAFCQETLHHTSILTWLQQDRILATAHSIHSAQGAQLQSLLQITSFPALAVLQPNPNTTTNSSSNSVLHLVLLVQGTLCRVDTLVPLLQAARHRHEAVRAEAHVRQWQRLQETELRRQQDEEYQATLHADQERERLVHAERERAASAVAAEQHARHEAHHKVQTALQAAKELVTDEPTSGGTMLRLVLPSGAKVNRRFDSHDTMATVKAFLTVHLAEGKATNTNTNANASIANIGLSTSFPRRTFDVAEDGLTLEAAGLAPQAVLMVQDLDA